MIIDKFDGEYSFLSNFYPCEIKCDGIKYPTAEHLYQSCKTEDEEERLMISKLSTPGRAKRMGQKITIHPYWDVTKLLAMELIIKMKFRKEPLKQMLLQTGDSELIESNNWNDTFWGVCDDVGENHLGKILMKIREELKNENKIN